MDAMTITQAHWYGAWYVWRMAQKPYAQSHYKGTLYQRVRPVAVTRETSAATEPSVTRKPSVRLTASMRDVIAWVRSSEARERIAIEDAAMQAREQRRQGYLDRVSAALARHAHEIVGYTPVTETWSPDTWKGLTTSREARYAERGRGTAAKVSIRDAYITPLMLRGLKTVGVATHPDASESDYVALVNAVRANPSWATLRRLMPGPHGYSSHPALNSVVPVSEYVAEREARHEARKTVNVAAPRESDSVRLASVIGYVGNVE